MGRQPKPLCIGNHCVIHKQCRRKPGTKYCDWDLTAGAHKAGQYEETVRNRMFKKH